MFRYLQARSSKFTLLGLASYKISHVNKHKFGIYAVHYNLGALQGANKGSEFNWYIMIRHDLLIQPLTLSVSPE